MGNDEVRKTEISPFERWSLSLGSTIGWGSLVVTCSNYLAQAGIAGSVLGLVLGFILMLMVAGNYHFLSARYPGPGGLYGYVKNVMGNDASFLAAWFMVLVQGHDYEIRDSIMDELNALIESNIGSDSVVASLGMAVFEKETDHTFQSVFARADSLMYERKLKLKSMGAGVRN